MKRLILAALALAALSSPILTSPAWAEPTNIVVRAHSKDAKFIGTSMGGVAIQVTDAKTGNLLASGLTSGGTGDTDRIMIQPRKRGDALAGAGDAAFKAILNIDRPTLVKVEATGPQGHGAAAITVTSMMWVLPGQPVAGDGWVLEFPGLVVEPIASGGELRAKITLMCGCPITPGGMWNADDYTVTAWTEVGGQLMAPVVLKYAGEPSMFEAAMPAGSGKRNLVVTARDAKSGNVGVARLEVRSR